MTRTQTRTSRLVFVGLAVAACTDDVAVSENTEGRPDASTGTEEVVAADNMTEVSFQQGEMDSGVSPETTNPDIVTPGNDAQAAVVAHNAVRDGLNVGLSELRWDAVLAEVAQSWADQLISDCGGPIYHRMPNDFGENIAQRNSIGFNVTMTVEEAVDGWAAEVDCWTYGAIQSGEVCESACIEAQNSTGCGHYTQLIWDRAETVGCGYASCETSDGWLSEVWVCNYDPPGNVIGQTPY